MIEAKQELFWTSNLKGYVFHSDEATIFYLTSGNYSLSVLSAKLYSFEIIPLHQKLWPFKCMMLKMLNSNFLGWEDTLSSTRHGVRIVNFYWIPFLDTTELCRNSKPWIFTMSNCFDTIKLDWRYVCFVIYKHNLQVWKK